MERITLSFSGDQALQNEFENLLKHTRYHDDGQLVFVDSPINSNVNLHAKSGLEVAALVISVASPIITELVKHWLEMRRNSAAGGNRDTTIGFSLGDIKVNVTAPRNLTPAEKSRVIETLKAVLDD